MRFAVGKPRHEGVEEVDTLRQNQDFDEVTRCINSWVKHFALQSQLRCSRFLRGAEYPSAQKL